MKKTIKITIFVLLLVAVFTCLSFSDSNQLNITKDYNGNTITIKSDSDIKALYIKFHEEPGVWDLKAGDTVLSCGSSNFIHEFVNVEEFKSSDTKTLTLSFKGVLPYEIYAFDGVDVPSWVQKWELPLEKADFMLISAHADDEDTFLAGLLPYYAVVKEYCKTQVVFLTKHTYELERHSERLDSLWMNGIKNYPLCMNIPDAYSYDMASAEWNLNAWGLSIADVENRLIDVINRCNPQVIATHDFNGEYIHGQHILIANVINDLFKKKEFPSVKKVYIHLYQKNEVKLSFMDEPSDKLDGLTPFQLSQKAYKCHKSQFYSLPELSNWLYGFDGLQSKASEIDMYCPLYYGLIYGDTSLDVNRNDLLEGIVTYEEQRILEEQAILNAKIEKLQGELNAAEEERSFYNQQIEELTKKLYMSCAFCVAGGIVIGTVISIVIRKIKRGRK